MSRALAMAMIAGVLAIAALTVFWVVLAPVGTIATSTPPSTEDSRKQAHDFLGGDPDRDVRGGQEMRPRW